MEEGHYIVGKANIASQPELVQEEQVPAWVPLSPSPEWRILLPSKTHINIVFLISLSIMVHHYDYV